MNFFDQGDLRLKGMLTEVSESHSKFRKVLVMVRIMAIQVAKGTSMVCSQCLASHYWRGWKFNHGEVFGCVHGIQMRMDNWNLRVVLSWMALFFADGARRDLSRFSNSFCIISPGPFSGGAVWVRVRWLVFAGWVEDETQL